MKACIAIIVSTVLGSSALFARDIKAHRARAMVKTDGILEKNEWPPHLFQFGFTQMEPANGAPSLEETGVAVQFDDKMIYVAFICKKSYPDPIVARQTRRDQIAKVDDVVAVSLDTYHDLRTAYWFTSNALNTQIDMRISDDAKYMDTNWDADWEARTQISNDGYTAEFAIPFSSVRFNTDNPVWGVNFGRFIPKHLETSYWSGTLDVDFRVSQYGTLSGLEFPESQSQINVIPFVTTRYESYSDSPWTLENGADAGLDMAIRYKNNINANLTINPDFATVEGDRERINMTRWELSFPEKRTFFLEGSELFRNRIQSFYTRRIGEIDFGGKATGKIGSYTFAAIGVRARAVDDNPASSKNESFPAYNQGVLRLKKDVGKSSTIGLLLVNKAWAGGTNRVMSMDGVIHFPHDFHFTTQFVAGGPGSLAKNYGGFVRLARENNIYHYHLRYTELAENLKESVNGIGFIRDDDRRELDSALRYKWWIKNAGIEYLNYFSNYNIFWSKTAGTLRSWEIVEQLTCYFKNKFSVDIEYVRDYQLFEKDFNNHSTALTMGYNTLEWSASRISVQAGRNFDRDFWMISASSRFKIRDQLSVSQEIRKLRFSPDIGDESTWLSITTLDYFFTPDLFLRMFTQYRSAADRIYVYGLFGWRFKLPTSAVYLVYTRDDFDNPGLSREKNEVLFLKFAYDFTL